MATLTQNVLSLADAYKQSGVQGKINAADVIFALADNSQGIIDDFVYQEANQGMTHLYTILNKLPDLAWGALYKGIPRSKAGRQTVTETLGFVEGLSSVDKRLLDLEEEAERKGALRMIEGDAFLEKMAQEIVQAMFYYSPTQDSKLPKGLGARFSQIATSGAGNQIVDGGGTGSDNTSVWFVTHGGKGLISLYPKGTAAGIKQEDKGEQRETDANGDPYFVMEELFTAHLGFGLGDYRHVSRVANIDVSDLRAGTVDIYGLCRSAYYKLHARRPSKARRNDDRNMMHTVMYANRDVIEALDAKATKDENVRLGLAEVEGREVQTYRGIPIRETDALLNTEERILSA